MCPSLGTDRVSVSQGSPYPRSSELRSGPSFKTGLGSQRMEVTPSGGELHMEEIWRSRLVCFEHDYALPALVLPISSVASGCGRSGTGITQDQTLCPPAHPFWPTQMWFSDLSLASQPSLRGFP